LISIGYTVNAIENLVINLPSEAIFKITADGIITFPDTMGLDDGSRMREMLHLLTDKKLKISSANLSFKTLYDLTGIEYTINAVDIKNQEHFIMNRILTPEMNVIDGIMASAAVPYVFSPIQ